MPNRRRKPGILPFKPDKPPSRPPALGFRRTNLPNRGTQPSPVHMGREGGWTTAGTFTSYRCGYDVSFWGEHQFNFLALVEVQPSVRTIHARPEELEWFDGNRWHVHVPDFLVRTDRGSSMFDIEEHGREKAPAARVMNRSLRLSLAERGIGYRMLSAKPLSANPRLSNATLVNASAWNSRRNSSGTSSWRCLPPGRRRARSQGR